jgi:exopolyphosphatase/guanosine-5'-triphosphate,3'-diphosphate pyrophosphatase
MKALDVESVDICPWALREGLILRKLDSEEDGAGFVGGADKASPVETSVQRR